MMPPDDESFEKAQDRVLGRSPGGLRLLLRRLRHLNWLKILGSALGFSIAILLPLLSSLYELPTYTLVGIGVMIFVLITILMIAAELFPLNVGDEEA
jgi:hypothetical protein